MRAWTTVIVAGAAATLSAAPIQDVPLDTLRGRLATYIESFETQLSAVVSEERYEQHVLGRTQGPSRRVLTSDFLLTRIAGADASAPEWVSFRDVVEVDGIPVQDRSDRLMKLFISPPGNANEQIRGIINASARHNLGLVHRTINVPTMALHYGRQTLQWRSDFSRGGRSRVDGHQVRELRFTERQLPRIIHTVDNAPARGTFWIDEATGRVHRTELRVVTGGTTATIGVTYGYEPKIDIWLPVEMTERYSGSGMSTITGLARYENFRSFTVTVDSTIKR